MRYKLYIIGIVAILLILFGRKVYIYTQSSVTEGTVIEIKPTNNDGLFYAGNDSFPVISFIDNFTEHSYQEPYQVRFKDLKTGDKVTIIYTDDNPNKVNVYSFLGFWMPFNEMGILLLLSLFWLFGVRVYFLMKED